MTVRTTHTEDRQRQVTDLIVAGEMAPDAIDAVVAAGLAAYAMDRVGDQQQSLDPRLHRSRLVAAARHAAIRRATASLVRAWDEAGIDTLLFKGFYLAEFVYPDPSWRAYSDVDLAVRSRADLSLSEVARLAAEVAARHEFEVVWWHGEEERLDSHHDRAYNGHELLQLAHIPTGTSVDAHRRLVHSNVSVRRQSDKGERLTRSVWERATASEFEGATVYLPAHIDSALVGLIAARSWSGDRHALRPHDPLDLDMLMRRGGFGRVELLDRAAELGLVATTRLFLGRCDLRSGRVELREPSPARAFWYDALLVSERGHRGLAQFSAAAAAAPGRVMAVLRELPAAARQVRRARTGLEPSWLEPDPATSSRAEARRLNRRTWRATQLGVRRALKLLGVDPGAHRELALACVHDSLVRRGFQVTRHGVLGDGWLEFSGQRLPVDQLLRGSVTTAQ